MLLRIWLAVMIIGQGAYSSEWGEHSSSGRSLAEEWRCLTLAVQRTFGYKISLDPRLDSIVLTDGRTLVTGRRVRNPTQTIMLRSYDEDAENQAYRLLGVVRTTTDTAVHYEALQTLAELAERGVTYALSGFGSLLDTECNPICHLPWPHRDNERAQWFDKVTKLREQQLYNTYTQIEKEEACQQLKAMLLSQAAKADEGDLLAAGIRQRAHADSDSSRSSGNDSLRRLLGSSSDDDENHKQPETDKNK